MKKSKGRIAWAIVGYVALGILILYIIYTGKQVL